MRYRCCLASFFLNVNRDKEDNGDGEEQNIDFGDDMSRIDIATVADHDDDVIS